MNQEVVGILNLIEQLQCRRTFVLCFNFLSPTPSDGVNLLPERLCEDHPNKSAVCGEDFKCVFMSPEGWLYIRVNMKWKGLKKVRSLNSKLDLTSPQRVNTAPPERGLHLRDERPSTCSAAVHGITGMPPASSVRSCPTFSPPSKLLHDNEAAMETCFMMGTMG